MKFDLSWFTTIPGILITCGVVLLIVALVIFIITSRKNKKEGKENSEDSKQDTSAPQSDQNATPVVVDNSPLPNIEANNSAVATPIEAPEAIPVPVETTPTPVQTVDAIPTPIEVAQPVVNSVPATPVVDVTPQPIPVEPVVVTPNVVDVAKPEVVPVAPTNPVINVANEPVVAPTTEKTSIYGGVSQIIPSIDLNQKSNHQIYGGADPLENTQTLPVTPNVTPIPVVESQPQVSTPTMTTANQPQPVVNVIPTVEEVVQPSSTDINSLMP